MNILDWIIITWLAISFIIGVRTGFIYHLGTFVGLILGSYIAGQNYQMLVDNFGENPWGPFVLFTVIIIVIGIIAGIFSLVLDKIFKFVSWLPFLKSVNKILGGLVAVITSIFLLGILMFFLSRVEISHMLTQTIAESSFAMILVLIGQVMSFILPESISELSKIY
ncbi:MAG: CvpA family protein [bacterium]|nr:CvpA family protein [bacterium]